MTDSFFLLILLALIVFLLVQLHVVGQLRVLQTLVQTIRGHQQDALERNVLVRFESENAQDARRARYRAKSVLRAELTCLGVPVAAVIEDVSVTGALLTLENNRDLQISEVYPISIVVPDAPPLQANFRVVRCLEEGTKYGGCFEDLPLSSKQVLASFINQQARNDLKKPV